MSNQDPSPPNSSHSDKAPDRHYCAIFWDLENCPPARGADPTTIVSIMREKLSEHGPIKLIQGYAGLSRIPEPLKASLQSSGVQLIDVPIQRKDAADKMLISDMVMFAVDNVPPQAIVLISGDQDYAYPLAKLRLRGYKVILVMPPGGAAVALKRQGDEVFEWSDFSLPHSSAEQPSPEAQESIAFEPLLLAIKFLQDQGIERPLFSQLGKVIHHLSPHWRQMGITNLSDYIDRAEDVGLVKTGGNPPQQWVQLERQTPYDDCDFTSPEERFNPLLDVLEQAEDENIPEPELAWLGSQLRFVCPNWRELTGHVRLIEYIQEAEDYGLLRVRHEGLQHYVRRTPKSGGPVGRVNIALASDIRLVQEAWESLRKDEILPTERALVGRMREITPGWFLQTSAFKSVKGLIKYVEDNGLGIVQGQAPQRVIQPTDNPIQGHNPELPIDVSFDHGITEETYRTFLEEIETFSIFTAKGRYKMAKMLRQHLPVLREFSLGKLLVLIQVALNRGDMVYSRGEILWEKKEGSRIFPPFRDHDK